MRQRTISDYFWRDPLTADLTQEDKSTLLYFLTSPSSNICGVYQIVWRIASAEMGWTSDQMMLVANRLEQKGLLVVNKDGWVWVKIWWAHNAIKGAFSPKLKGVCFRQINFIPAEWQEEYAKSLKLQGIDLQRIGYPYPIHTPQIAHDNPGDTRAGMCSSNINTDTPSARPAYLTEIEKMKLITITKDGGKTTPTV